MQPNFTTKVTKITKFETAHLVGVIFALFVSFAVKTSSQKNLCSSVSIRGEFDKTCCLSGFAHRMDGHCQRKCL
jgi:hypothetical protein